MNKHLARPAGLISIVYLLLALLHFSPIAVAYKMVFPLAFLTLCAISYSTWPMVLAMGFSALGDYMGVCHNFWGQMGAFAWHMLLTSFSSAAPPQQIEHPTE